MRIPIRARLTLVSGTLMAVVLVAVGAFVFLRVEAQLLAAVDAGLRSRADLLLTTLGDGGRITGSALVESDEAFAQVVDANGVAVVSSPGIPNDPLVDPGSIAGPTVRTRSVTTLEEVVPARVLAVRTPDGGALVVGASLEDQQEALGLLLAQLLIGGPVAVALASVVGWLVAGAALRPVEHLRLEAEAVSGSEPGRRLAVPPSGDELARLAESLNRMLARLEEAAGRERRFVRDASHELRTPLGNLKAELDLALRRARSQDELEAALRSAAVETDRLTRLAEDLLVLARFDAGRIPIRLEPVDLSRLVRDTVASFDGRASEMDATVAATVADGVGGEFDGVRVRQAIGNLLDNAMRHAGRGGTVGVELRREDPDLVIEVTDSGPGFDPQFLESAFDPLSRADDARTRAQGGAGLGLTIVRAVTEAHGGWVEAANRPEGGAVVRLRLPQPLI